MTVTRSEFYQSGVALLIWLQKIDKFGATSYDIGLPEMKYLASSLSSQECYDFYNLLSHRRAMRNEMSIYAEKERAQEISCISLLATWLTDPAESKFRSNENIELKLRTIGRRDLAHWILRKIESTLRRRQLDVMTNRRIEESEMNNVAVANRTGQKIIPMPFVEAEDFIKNQHAPEDRHSSCLFWKVFFSSLVVLLLVTLVLCFYRFVYTKLRCICRRFEDSEDQEHCLPEQTYGTTSHADCRTRDSKERTNRNKETSQPSEKFSSTNESYDETFASTIADRRFLLRDSANRLTTNWPAIDRELPSSSRNIETTKFSIESQNPTETSEKTQTSSSRTTSEKQCLTRTEFSSDEKSTFKSPVFGNRKSTTRGRAMEAQKIDGTRSENWLAPSAQRNKKTARKRPSPNYRESRDQKDSECPRWTSCSCNLIARSTGPNSLTSCNERCDESSAITKNMESTIVSSRESLTGLSETYDELGMLFSLHLKRQSRPCRRKYCTLTRNLRKSRTPGHDAKKCRNRGKSVFGEKIIINWDRRPACSSGQNICRDTYDEYEIMRATREEREMLARTIIRRRKSFLDQPCLSPDIVEACEKLTNRE